MFLKAKNPIRNKFQHSFCSNNQGDLEKIHLQNGSASVVPFVQAFQEVLALLTVGSVDASMVSEKTRPRLAITM